MITRENALQPVTDLRGRKAGIRRPLGNGDEPSPIRALQPRKGSRCKMRSEVRWTGWAEAGWETCDTADSEVCATGAGTMAYFGGSRILEVHNSFSFQLTAKEGERAKRDMV